MEPMEQMMMQVWLGGLLAHLKDDKVEHVINELEIALARIEEDQDGSNSNDRTKSGVTPASSTRPSESDEEVGEARPESDTGRVHEGDADSADSGTKLPNKENGDAPIS